MVLEAAQGRHVSYAAALALTIAGERPQAQAVADDLDSRGKTPIPISICRNRRRPNSQHFENDDSGGTRLVPSDDLVRRRTRLRRSHKRGPRETYNYFVSASTLASLLGTALPLIQAPMAGAQGSALAIAVSNAGGLGSLPAAMLTPDALRDEIAAITAATSKPYNVNFFCHIPPAPDADREARWRDLLGPYYRELGIDPQTIRPGPGRAPFDHNAADVLSQCKPPVVSFHFGLPSKELLERVRQWRPTILSSATTVDEARWLEAQGVDAIIAQGVEAGGHRGMFLSDEVTTQVGTFALVPQIVSAVTVPVIAAGGIADAAGVAAARALGAAAVQVGTAYLLCPEATTTRVHRDALASPRAKHTALTNIFTGRPARGIVNRLIAELGPLNPAAPAFPLATAAVMPLRLEAETRGSGDFSPLWAGQNATGCRNIPAAELTRELTARLSA